MTTNLFKARFYSCAGFAWGYVRQDKTGTVSASLAFELPGRNPVMLSTPVWNWDGKSDSVANARRALLRAAREMNLSRTTLTV